MPRIAYIVGDFVTGGVKSYLLGYLSSLNTEEFSFDIFAYSGVSNDAIAKVETLGGSVVELPHVSNPFAYRRTLVSLLKKGNYDIAHGMLNSLNFLAMSAARSASIPVRIAENLSAGHRREKKSIVKNALRPFGPHAATHLAANSHLAAEWLYKSRAGECKVLPNPIDLSYWTEGRDERREVRERLQLGDSLVLGWIGRYAPQKNPLFLLDIIRSLVDSGTDAKLLMVGYGPLEGAVSSKIEELGLSDLVIEVGGTEDIRPFYRAMDVFVLPSLYEGLPVVAMEAQAMGLPCVISSEVTPETAVNPNVRFVSLESSPSEWADVVVSASEARYPNQSLLSAAGYDVRDSSARLVAYYHECLLGVFNAE